MKSTKTPYITLVGAGNAAWHLSHAFLQSGIIVEKVINRTLSRAREIAAITGATASSEFYFDNVKSTLIVLAMNDSALPDLAGSCKFPAGKVIVHTSGSVGMDIFKGHAHNFGVFYPFQTLTRGVELDYRNLPFFIEGNTVEVTENLSSLASKISDTVVQMNSEDRRKFHLAGAFANNFTNHLIARTFDYLNENKLDQKLILPLISETVRKLEFIAPRDGQTGPARRKNTAILEKHIAMLKDYPELKDLYKLISDSIITYYS